MKNTKKILYDILITDPTILGIIGDADQVFLQNDDADTNRAAAKFSEDKSIITYYRISERPGEATKISSLFQITCWDKDNSKSETLKNAVINCFHKRLNSNGISYISLTDVGQDIYDKELNVRGIPLTFVFIFKDHEYGLLQ